MSAARVEGGVTGVGVLNDTGGPVGAERSSMTASSTREGTTTGAPPRTGSFAVSGLLSVKN